MTANNLSKRLRERVYRDVVPGLATAIARRAARERTLSEDDLRFIYEESLFILFRLVFLAYAEDKGLLPYATNDDYRAHALKTRAQRLAERWNEEGELAFDAHASDLWQGAQQLFRAVDQGNSEWDVPAYDGGLFSTRPEVSPVGAAIAELELSNAEFGAPLANLLVELTDEGAYGAIDFRSLSVREFGTIYEGLLESSLSLAQGDLTIDKAGTYVPAREGEDVVVAAGEVYLHNRSGARKASGSYFTKEFAVEHLLDHALEPALDEHLERLAALLEQGDEAGAAEAFFDFRVADIAMGSGHFLVNAVDHIEARLTSFLTEHPLPAVNAELATLRRTALDRLGEAGEATEIERAALVRRQVARRCIYGVDVNAIAVELARLAIWIHTFVPGLPLSYLDRTLVCGNSLTGIGTLDEAIETVEGTQAGGALSLARVIVEDSLERAREPLRRLGRISDATPEDVEAARQAQAEAQRAVRPAAMLFDLAVAARLGEIDALTDISADQLENTPGRERAAELARRLGSLHFPVAFPEVFLRARPGFDCIVGNPPWEEVKTEELQFWNLRFPGMKKLPKSEQQDRIERLRSTRADLQWQYEAEKAAADLYRRVLAKGPFRGMETGDADLYKAFGWRVWQLTRSYGYVGLVLPRSIMAARGSAEWRAEVLPRCATSLLPCQNVDEWAFTDVNVGYSLYLASIEKESPARAGVLHLWGLCRSEADLKAAQSTSGVTMAVDELRSADESLAIPNIESELELQLFETLIRVPSFGGNRRDWEARPIRELDVTLDAPYLVSTQPDAAPVFNHLNIGLFTVRGATKPFGWADYEKTTQMLQERRANAVRNKRSAFFGMPSDWASDVSTLPAKRPRLAFRSIVHSSNPRKVWVALVPPDVFLTNSAPYLFFRHGDVDAQAFVMAMLNSSVCDWFGHLRIVLNLNFFILNALPIPEYSPDSAMARRAARLSASLAHGSQMNDDGWAHLAYVDPVNSEEALTEIDAIASLLYGLDDEQLPLIWTDCESSARPALRHVLAYRRRWQNDT